MMQAMEIPLSDILKAKTVQELHDIHNSLSASYMMVLDKKLSENLQKHINNFRYTEGNFDDISFELIDTPEKFYEESSIMNHCVKTYCSDVSKGHYIIYSVKDLTTNDRATLSIGVSTTFTFNQLKGKNNVKSTDRIIESVKNFIDNFFNIRNYDNCYDLNRMDFKVKIQPEDEVMENNMPLIEMVQLPDGIF